MALLTTVRPLHTEEFDLDLVCEVEGWTEPAMDLYRRTGDRLEEHGEYRKMLEPKKRCCCLNYAGDFHLDALPGCEDRSRSGRAIEVPDQELAGWKPPSLSGFVAGNRTPVELSFWRTFKYNELGPPPDRRTLGPRILRTAHRRHPPSPPAPQSAPLR